MSDSGNSFGEALESMTTNTKKAVGGTIADFKNSVKGQVTGNGGSSSLPGGDLFSPDMLTGQAKKSPPSSQSTQSLVQSSQQSGNDPSFKTPEEAAKIQHIQQELQSLHQKYYQDFLAKAEGRDRKTQEVQQEKAQEEQQKQADNMQKDEEKKQDDQSVFRAQRGSEIKGGLG